MSDVLLLLEGKYSLESTDPCESEIRAPPQLTIGLKLSCYLFTIKKSPVYGVFLDSNLHIRLAIVTENELGLAFPLGTFRKNFVHIRPRFI